MNNINLDEQHQDEQQYQDEQYQFELDLIARIRNGTTTSADADYVSYWLGINP
ncbi:MAG: hypothetical protein ACYCOU_13355 [Sulfobacillus sp.]